MDYKNTGHLNRDTKVLSCLLEELNKRIRLLTSVATDTQTLLQEFIHPAYTVGYAIATNASIEGIIYPLLSTQIITSNIAIIIK